jgi:hypothetical protein
MRKPVKMGVKADDFGYPGSSGCPGIRILPITGLINCNAVFFVMPKGGSFIPIFLSFLFILFVTSLIFMIGILLTSLLAGRVNNREAFLLGVKPLEAGGTSYLEVKNNDDV